MLSLGFFYCVSVVFSAIFYYIDTCIIHSRNFLENDFGGIFFLAIIFTVPLTVIYYIALNFIPLYFKENSDFSFANKYGFTQTDSEPLKRYEEEDPDLNISLCSYSNYENCITLQKDGIIYYMNERFVSAGKGGNYESICLIKHNKCDFPSFYMRQKDPVADTFSKYLFKSESIVFPEDSAFSRKFILKIRPSLILLYSEKDLRNYFDMKVRETFVKYGVYDALYYSCDSYELKIKVPRRLKESEKEKIFLLANALFIESDKEYFKEDIL